MLAIARILGNGVKLRFWNAVGMITKMFIASAYPHQPNKLDRENIMLIMDLNKRIAPKRKICPVLWDDKSHYYLIPKEIDFAIT